MFAKNNEENEQYLLTVFFLLKETANVHRRTESWEILSNPSSLLCNSYHHLHKLIAFLPKSQLGTSSERTVFQKLSLKILEAEDGFEDRFENRVRLLLGGKSLPLDQAEKLYVLQKETHGINPHHEQNVIYNNSYNLHGLLSFISSVKPNNNTDTQRMKCLVSPLSQNTSRIFLPATANNCRQLYNQYTTNATQKTHPSERKQW